MAGAMLSFSVMAIFGRELTPNLNTFEIMFVRSLVGLVIVLQIGFLIDSLSQIKTNQLGLHLLRNMAHFTGQNLWFLAIAFIPFSQLFALEFSTPIWIVLLAPCFVGEALTPRRLLAVGLGFLGVLIVARPDIDNLNPAVFVNLWAERARNRLVS